jgi:hypothetical protein
MRSNNEKWEFYHSQIQLRNIEYAKSNSPNLPKHLYEVSPNGMIRTLNVEKVSYGVYYYKSPKRATTKEVEAVIKDYETPPELTIDKIYIHWRSENSTSAIKLIDLPNWITDIDTAAAISIDRIENIKREEHLLNNGYFRCARCRKVLPGTLKQTKKIFGRGRKNVFNSYKGVYENKACVTEEMLDFCSGECEMNEQMSREG